MSYGKSFSEAFYRSIDAVKASTASALRMEVTPSATTMRPMPIWKITQPGDLRDFATGCDKDIGGLSSLELGIKDGAGRMWGTLSNQVPRGANVERTGYAGMRNRTRPTLFGLQTWDTTLHPFLALRLRNSIPHTSSTPAAPSPSPLSQTNAAYFNMTALQRAKASLGYGLEESPGPKFYVNIQTDGPVTSDLFQHRIWLDPSAGDQWQTVVIPLDRFMLLNTGELSGSQMGMMRQAIRTVGVSCVLDTPRFPTPGGSSQQASSSPSSSVAQQHQQQKQQDMEQGDVKEAGSAPSVLRAAVQSASSGSEQAAVQQQQKHEPDSSAPSQHAKQLDEDDWARDGDLRSGAGSSSSGPMGAAARGVKRGQSFRYDLGIAGVKVLGTVEEAQSLEW